MNFYPANEMNPILQLIEAATKGKTYRSHRFSYDAEMRVPSLAYDDLPLHFTLEKESGETRHIPSTQDLTGLAKRLETDEPLFRYFLDGSRRVYKIDDIKFSKRIFPIVGGQVAVACCERADRRHFKKALLENELVMALPTYAASRFVFEKPRRANQRAGKILMSGDEHENGLESGEINLVSANLINERNPVCYGTDQRWANHLYPIYLTEIFLKSQFLSELHFLNLF